MKLHDKGAFTYAFHGITPDGQFALFSGRGGKFPPDGWSYERSLQEQLTLHRLPLFGSGKAEDTGIVTGFDSSFVVQSDGGILHTRSVAPANRALKAPSREYVTTRYDANGNNPTKLDLPTDMRVCAVLPGGDFLLHSDYTAEDRCQRVFRYKPGGKTELLSGELNLELATVSADGRQILGTHFRSVHTKPDQETVDLKSIDTATGKDHHIDSPVGAGFIRGFWSPDGRQIVTQFYKKEKVPTESMWSLLQSRIGGGEIAVCDPDGGNRQQVLKLDDDGQGPGESVRLLLVGWTPAPQKVNAPVPKEMPGGELIWTHNTKTGVLTAYTPDGDLAKTITVKDGKHFLGLTPNGQRIAFAGEKGKLAEQDAKDGLTLHTRPVSDAVEETDTGLSIAPDDVVYWSPDGTQVVRRRFGPMDPSGSFTYDHVLFDMTTKKEKKVELPVNHYVIGWAVDGKTWLVHEYVRADLRDPKLPRYRMMSVPVGGGKPPTSLCDGASFITLERASDGKSYHGVGHAHSNPSDDTDATYRRWFRVSDTGQAALLKTFNEFADIDLRLSPDRSRVVCLGRTTPDDTADTVLRFYNPDGSNEKKLHTLEKDGQSTRLLGWYPGKPVGPAASEDPKAKPLVKEPIKVLPPKVKPPQPAKLDRPPPAPEALRKELAGWDEKYRHGSEGKFAELEKRAAELTTEYDTDDNQARVWYAVAHIAGQSDIGKQADRVRKYAEKCLKVSRDPLDRGRLYSLLASCEEVAGGEFAGRRRKATDWLLKGYRELLAQELPDQKPELPGVMKFRIGDEGQDTEQARAKHAAQVAAHEHVQWVCEQIDRRDTLVLGLRNLYAPNPKVHGHGPDGPAELRKLAEAVLPTADDVDTLMERVLPGESKAKPPAKESIKAPVPVVKEHTMGLTASVTPEKAEIMLGEPTYFTFTVENPTDKGWGFEEGTYYLNRLERPNSFEVEVTGQDRKVVRQPDAGIDMGGVVAHPVELPAGGTHTFTLFLPHWATFDTPGEYTISVRRKLSLVPLGLPINERRKAKPEVVSLSASAKIVVTKAEAKKFGDLIDTLGADLRDPKRLERATKKLLEIQDERVIPHFIELGKRPQSEPRCAACEGLKKFRTDEAFVALKAMAATTADDLKGTAINRQKEESFAQVVRLAAISALADSPHPDALALVWKAVDDEQILVRMVVLQKAYRVESAEARKVIEQLTNDPDERVRTEAKRCADWQATEKSLKDIHSELDRAVQRLRAVDR